jgi:RNA 2',3'-cyclic 3'-phosphodiesterase
MRAFVAVDLPSVRPALGFPDPPGRAAAPEHLTLHFFGEIDPAGLPAIRGAVAATAARHVPFDVEIGGLGAFPDRRRPRVVYAEIRTGADRLSAIHEELERELGAIGVPAERRPFVPHLTVLRIRGPRDLDRGLRLLEADPRSTLASARVDALLLKESHLRPAGAVHELLGRYPLAGASPS